MSDDITEYDVEVSFGGRVTVPAGGRDEHEAIDSALESLAENRELIDILDVQVEAVREADR